MKIENLTPSDFSNLKQVLESQGVYTGTIFNALVQDIEQIQNKVMTEFEIDKSELQTQNFELKQKLQDFEHSGLETNLNGNERTKSFSEKVREKRVIGNSKSAGNEYENLSLAEKIRRKRII